MVKTRKNRKLKSRRTRNYRKKIGGASFGSGFPPGSLSGHSYAGFGSHPLPTQPGFFTTDPAIAHMMHHNAVRTQQGARTEANARRRAFEARAQGQTGFGSHNVQHFGAAGGIMRQPGIIAGFGGSPAASFGAQRSFGGLAAPSFGAPASAHFGMSGYERPTPSFQQQQNAKLADDLRRGESAAFRTQSAQHAALNHATQPDFRHIHFIPEQQSQAQAPAQIKSGFGAGQTGRRR